MSSAASTPSENLTMHLSNDLEMIAFSRMVIRRLLPPLDNVQEPMFYGAFTEIVTNAVEEHRRQQIDSDVDVRVALNPAEITVTDRGAGFDPDNQPESQAGNSGLGLVISRAVIPDLTFETGPSGTSVHIPYPDAAS